MADLEDEIQILEGREAVRKRPAMYISDNGDRGLFHMIREALADAWHEALLGRCSRIQVTIEEDFTVTIEDNGRPIPVDVDKRTGLPWLEAWFTLLNPVSPGLNPPTRQKEPIEFHRMSPMLYGVGISVVNYLSEFLLVRTVHGDLAYEQSYETGISKGPIGKRPAAGETGNRVRFRPDFTIFHEPSPGFRRTLISGIRDLTLFAPGLRLSIILQPGNRRLDFEYTDGVVDYLREVEGPAVGSFYNPEIFRVLKEADGMTLDLALRFESLECEDSIQGFVCGIRSVGGRHLQGLRSALKAVRTPPMLDELKSQGVYITPCRCTAVMLVALPDPQWGGATKDVLLNREVEPFVRDAVLEQLPKQLLKWALEKQR